MPMSRAGAGIAPGHGVVPPGAAARLPQRAEDGIARAVDVQDRAQLLHPGGRDEFGRHALQGVGVRGAQVAAHLVVGLRQHHHAAGAEHDVVVQVLAQRLVEAARLFVDRGRGVLQVVRPDDRGVAPGVAAAKPALFDDRDIGDAVVLAKVIGGGQTMPPGADDDGVIGGFRFGRGPGAFPAHVVAQRLAGDGERPNSVSSGPHHGLNGAGSADRVGVERLRDIAAPASGTIGKIATFAKVSHGRGEAVGRGRPCGRMPLSWRRQNHYVARDMQGGGIGQVMANAGFWALAVVLAAVVLAILVAGRAAWRGPRAARCGGHRDLQGPVGRD